MVFGHADGDGYLAAEQTRTNLKVAGLEAVSIVVSSETSSYKFWEKTFGQLDLSAFRLVVCVDIAFNFKNPIVSLRAIVETAATNSGTEFVIVDHHPLLRPRRVPQNLKLIEVKRVYDCCLGPPSDDLMVVAAICDGEKWSVCDKATEIHEKRALGVKRAAADIGGLAGVGLLRLLSKRHWSFFEALAEEPNCCHQRARGRRTSKSLPSPLLQSAVIPIARNHSKLLQVQ